MVLVDRRECRNDERWPLQGADGKPRQVRRGFGVTKRRCFASGASRLPSLLAATWRGLWRQSSTECVRLDYLPAWMRLWRCNGFCAAGAAGCRANTGKSCSLQPQARALPSRTLSHSYCFSLVHCTLWPQNTVGAREYPLSEFCHSSRDSRGHPGELVRALTSPSPGPSCQHWRSGPAAAQPAAWRALQRPPGLESVEPSFWLPRR